MNEKSFKITNHFFLLIPFINYLLHGNMTETSPSYTMTLELHYYSSSPTPKEIFHLE